MVDASSPFGASSPWSVNKLTTDDLRGRLDCQPDRYLRGAGHRPTLGTWVIVQRTGAPRTGLWLVWLFGMLLGTLGIGVFELYALTSTPNGPS